MYCGWDLLKKVTEPPEPEPLEKKLRQCPECELALPEQTYRIAACPYCGTYLGFNAKTLSPELVQIAKEWTGRTWDFGIEVLGVSTRIANTLGRNRVTPLETLALEKDLALAIRNFGEKSYKELETARSKWKKKR